jgi:hypothetical protein
VPLPEFLILGAPKCGTTALADALAAHPALFIPERKEPSFFDVNWERGLDWYAQFFATARPGQQRGEATPDYFASPLAAERIARTNPDVKMIAVARDPVARAHSHYWFRWNTGRERRGIDQVIADELAAPDDPNGYMIRHGLYGHNAETYRERLGASRLHLILFERLIKDPAVVLAEAQRYLGVEVRDLSLSHANEARNPRTVFVTRAVQWAARYQGPPKRLLRRLVAGTGLQKLRRRILRATSRPQRNPPLSPETHARLTAVFADDYEHFRALMRAPAR